MTAIRMQFFTLAALFFVGIWLTGFQNAHWFLWVPVVLLVFAGITGICPGLILWKKSALNKAIQTELISYRPLSESS